ncbi:hypothetical protein [Microbacterium sp. HMWF026]|uniref:hypothetical protein n=1 Tax=Microbacterium sp. HMWF026 TaxID=2056861 RepID=UPI0011B228DE|nr:hypothetical protein [Microbacterium sp. HMWF026]
MGRDTSKKSQSDRKIREARASENARIAEAHERLIERLARLPRDERVEYIRQHSYDGLEFGRLLHEANARAEDNRLQETTQEQANLSMARLLRGQRLEREWREEQDRAPQADDSNPEANLDALMRKAQEFEAAYAPIYHDDALPEADYFPHDDQDVPQYHHEPQLEAYGSQAVDPLDIERADVERRAVEQAEREAWTVRFAVKQEAERAAREARTAARRAEQDAKRGVMKQARQRLAQVLTDALERAGEVDARLLTEALPSAVDKLQHTEPAL